MAKKSNEDVGYNRGDKYEDRPPAPENKSIKLCFINSCILYYFFASKKIISCKKKGPRNIGPFNLIT